MTQLESKKDTMLKRVQLSIAIVASIATLSVGIYNVKKTFFTPTGPGTLSLEVRSEDGRGIGKASVQVMGPQGAVVASFKTSSSGRSELEDLEPSNYSLKVSKTGFEPESLVFEIEPGETTELEIELKEIAMPIAAPAPAAPQPQQPQQESSVLRNTVEELGASWLKTLASPKTKPEEKAPTEAISAS
ncbi:MAG TPA: carboxypeptidase-like regulatory domain-containing protein [Candidatus Omnitrophota bacterium]|nr:carboxypeptidase-like regulatory domain-containing protein [Candidatus Omnitrophota bacterium]